MSREHKCVKILQQNSTQASAIVNQVLLEELPDVPCLGLPKPAHLVRNANSLRQKLRLTEPRDLEFELELEHVPDNFFRNNVRVSKMNVNTIY